LARLIVREAVMSAGAVPEDGPVRLGPVELPEGRRIFGWTGDAPRLWATSGPVPDGARVWRQLAGVSGDTGLVPIVLAFLDGGHEGRPWDEGELDEPGDLASVSSVDVASVLADNWSNSLPEDEEEFGEEDAGVLAPFGLRFPGLASAQDRALTDAEVAEALNWGGAARIGLVPASRPADVLALIGHDNINRDMDPRPLAAVFPRARAADLSPGPRPSPDVADPGAGGAWRPHRLTVLAGVLDREQGDLTGTEVMRRELDHAASLATLAPVWADVTRACSTRRHEAAIRALLPPGDWQRIREDAERGTLARLLRAAELAGHDTDGVIRHAVGKRDFAGARSIAAVLHGRIRRIVGTPEPVAALGYHARTPVIDDPVDGAFAVELAAAMDARAAVLGERAALDRQVWAVSVLGEVPADPADRADWTRRAGIAAAYREELGWASQTDPIGRAPEQASPELRASWHAAYAALRMPDLDRDTRAATDGELLVRRAAYRRQAAWAPPHVAEDLREAHLAEDTCRADAVLAWHQADAARDWVERSLARQQALALSSRAQQAGGRRQALDQIAEARGAWREATEQARQRALAADTELRRRHPGIDRQPLHPEQEHGVRTQPNIGSERGELMRQREAEALRETRARRTADRQEPLGGRRAGRHAQPDLEPEAGG
jgi:hypothetical protein